MTSFKKTTIRNFAKVSSFTNTDTQYWKKYDFPITVREFTAIDYIDVSAVEPYYIAVTTGPKIDIYHQQTAQIWRSLTRFQKGAYGAKFRKDGQLLVAGSEEAQVKLFNFKQKQLLRIFKGHSGPVHRADFIPGRAQVVSFSDDKTLRLWDIADEKELCKFDEEHKDFIRAGASNPASEHLVISGSYDHTVRVWDTRTGASVMAFQHGSPVQDIVCYPTGSVLASAGGTEVKIWDLVGGKVLSVLSQHHKTITCLSLAASNSRLLSGSLDRHVKVYDLSTYAPLHARDYPAPVLSLAVAPGDSTLVTGMLSGGCGLLSFEHRSAPEERKSNRSTDPRNAPRQNYKIRPGDELVEHIEKGKLTRYDKMLSHFEFSKCLDIVLQSGTASKNPHVTVAIFRELIRRGGLGTALAGRDARSLNPVFKFLTKHIRNPTFHRILIEVSNILLDIYEDSAGDDPKILDLLSRLNAELEMDMQVSLSGMSLMGAIEMFYEVTRDRDPSSMFSSPCRLNLLSTVDDDDHADPSKERRRRRGKRKSKQGLDAPKEEVVVDVF